MIRKLQIKFVCIIMALMTIVLFCIVAAINITMERSTNTETRMLMQRIADSDGHIKTGLKPTGTPPAANFTGTESSFQKDKFFPRPEPVPQKNFSIKLDANGEMLEIISDRNQSYTEAEVADYLANALSTNATYGSVGQLKYLIVPRSYGQIVVFLDNSIQTNATIRLFWITLFVAVGSLIVLFFISVWLSAWAIRPVKKAYEAQRQFVADASHELKTPLTVISANLDVISSELPENKWLGFIRFETTRMSQLVHNLLYLAKSDASEQNYNKQNFNLSSAVEGAALPFESICFEQHKILTLSLTQGLTYYGDEQRIVQLVGILLDNALKNSTEGAEIRVSLTPHGERRILEVYNTGEGIAPDALDKLFDRFYRGDSSRARQTGGYGLGLAIAKTIVLAHGGKIIAESAQGKWAKFTATL